MIKTLKHDYIKDEIVSICMHACTYGKACNLFMQAHTFIGAWLCILVL